MVRYHQQQSESGQEEIDIFRQRLTGIFNSARDGIAFAGLDDILLDVNDAFCRLTGYSREELLSGMTRRDYTPQEYRALDTDLINEVIQTGNTVYYEKEYLRKDGTRLPVAVTAFSVRGETGEVIRYSWHR